jgi:hypothetical protein
MRVYKEKPGLVTLKDMSIMREADRAQEQRTKTSYELRDYSLKHRVHIFRDLNEEATRDMIFKLVVDDKEVLIDAEQLMRILRWI